MSHASGKAGSALLAERLILPLSSISTKPATLADRIGVHVCVRMLKSDEHMLVGQAQIRVRVHVAGHVGERVGEAWMKRSRRSNTKVRPAL